MSGSTELARNGICESGCSSTVLNAARHGMSLERRSRASINDTRRRGGGEKTAGGGDILLVLKLTIRWGSR
jgi:hypothetical protein